MGSMFSQIYGNSPPAPNRAERRAREKRDRAAQKKGQRAYEATLSRKAERNKRDAD